MGVDFRSNWPPYDFGFNVMVVVNALEFEVFGTLSNSVAGYNVEVTSFDEGHFLASRHGSSLAENSKKFQNRRDDVEVCSDES